MPRPTYDASASANINFGPRPGRARSLSVCPGRSLCVSEPLNAMSLCCGCCQSKLFHTSAEEIIKTSISFNKRHRAGVGALARAYLASLPIPPCSRLIKGINRLAPPGDNMAYEQFAYQLFMYTQLWRSPARSLARSLSPIYYWESGHAPTRC